MPPQLLLALPSHSSSAFDDAQHTPNRDLNKYNNCVISKDICWLICMACKLTIWSIVCAIPSWGDIPLSRINAKEFFYRTQRDIFRSRAEQLLSRSKIKKDSSFDSVDSLGLALNLNIRFSHGSALSPQSLKLRIDEGQWITIDVLSVSSAWHNVKIPSVAPGLRSLIFEVTATGVGALDPFLSSKGDVAGRGMVPLLVDSEHTEHEFSVYAHSEGWIDSRLRLWIQSL